MITRRGFVGGALSAAGLFACTRGPLIQPSRPRVTHGVQAGDVQSGRALVWARCDEPARMLVDWETAAGSRLRGTVRGPVVGPGSGFAATVALADLPAGQTIAYRVRFEREAARGTSDVVAGTFVTPAASDAPFRFAWTGDTCGQGYGRNPAWGGMRGYAALLAARPAFLLHSGDMIYGDGPILPTKTLADGRVWTNVSNDRVARVAQELDDFRARFAYNLEDEHVQALAREVPILAQWDDHETHDNWWPGEQLVDPRYTRERDASTLARHARRAMLEWTPTPPGPVQRVVRYGPLLDVIVLDCRSFRSPNDSGAGTAMLGAAQVRETIAALARSTARWKIIACDQPIGVRIGDGPDDARIEGFADGTPALTGREHELAALLAGIKAAGVTGVVWLTADVHYAAAHHYDPRRATVTDFDPFWEFIAGPIHAGTFGPNALDATFGPEIAFQWAPPPGQANLAPWDGLQSFGTLDVSREALVVQLWGIDGRARYRVELT